MHSAELLAECIPPANAAVSCRSESSECVSLALQKPCLVLVPDEDVSLEEQGMSPKLSVSRCEQRRLCTRRASLRPRCCSVWHQGSSPNIKPSFDAATSSMKYRAEDPQGGRKLRIQAFKRCHVMYMYVCICKHIYIYT